ncbi:Ubiquitin carboxyl-terminal hydrolase family protein, partial [Reticulomyxa filosa]
PSKPTQQQPTFTELHPPEYYDYRLVGILVHTGNANSGHYYSYGESPDGKWWEFNDTEVSPFDPQNIDAETFGGMHVTMMDDPQNPRRRIQKEIEKPFNAYMLVYKRKLGDYHPLTATGDKRRESTNNTAPLLKTSEQPLHLSTTSNEKKENKSLSKIARLPIAEPVERNIWNDNLEFFTNRNVFDFEYLTFLWNVVQTTLVREMDLDQSLPGADELSLVPTGPNSHVPPSPDDMLRAIQITTSFVFEILIRSKDNASYPQWMHQLYQLYVVSQSGRKWLLHKICTQPQWFANILFRCTHEPVRLAFVDLILGVLTIQRQQEKESYTQFAEKVNDPQEMERINEWPSLSPTTENKDNDHKTADGSIPFSPAAILDADTFACARFIAHMVRFLAVTTEYHQKIGTIRAIVGFFLNDWFHLHFNRAMAGKDNNGKKQYKRILPPRVAELIQLLSILIRSCNTPTYPLQRDSNKADKTQGKTDSENADLTAA